MNPRRLRLFVLFVMTLTVGIATSLPAASLEEGFANPPRQARPQVWWYWINGNVSKEGIRADLEDMKRVGIGGVQFFDGSLYQPAGPVRYHSDLWHDHVQYTLRTADELGLEFGSMVCAGWSMTGGPWVTPEKSMKLLVWSETPVAGGKPFAGKLPQPLTKEGFYRDVAVLAVPDDPEDSGPAPAVSSSAQGLDLKDLIDGDLGTSVKFPDGEKTPSVTFSYPQPTRRQLLRVGFSPSATQLKMIGTIQVSDDGQRFKTIHHYTETVSKATVSRTIEVPFEPTTARHFRVILRGEESRQPWPLIAWEMSLADIPRISEVNTKIGIEKINADPRPGGTNTNAPRAIRPEQVLDVTGQMKPDGTLDWTAPPGKWVVLRFGYTSTGSTNHPAVPEGHGLEVDKFDPELAAFHFEQALGRQIREAGDLAGKTYTHLLCDSWEAGAQTWTAKFPERFREKRGYDLLPWLPCVTGRVVGSLAESEAFLADFRLTLGELFAGHFASLRELAHEHGIKLYAEAYGGFLDEFRAAEEVDVPMCEFWLHMTSKSCQRATSLAHTTGKPIIASESFTSRPPDGRWQDYPFSLKPVGDAALVEGINRMSFHSYVHQPRSDLLPGFTHSRYGTHFGRANSWWPHAGGFVQYLGRCQYLLQQGNYVADVLYLRHEDLERGNFDDYPPTPRGHRYDFIAQKQFLQTGVSDGKIQLAIGPTYRLIALPKQWNAALEALRHLDELVSAGATVVGPAPTAPVGLRDLRENLVEWKSLVARLWPQRTADSGQQAGGGGVRQESDLAALLATTGVEPDFRYSALHAGDASPAASRPLPAAGSSSPDVRFIHRAGDGFDLYFLSNQTGQPVEIDADFRIHARQPELWDAVSGKISKPISFESAGGRMKFPLALEQAGSVFVVFRQPLPQRWATSVTRDGKKIASSIDRDSDGTQFVAAEAGEYTVLFSDDQKRPLSVPPGPEPSPVDGPWTVAFQQNRGAPASVTLDRLVSLSTHRDPGVRYFSGVATYTTTFELSPDAVSADVRCVLELGQVQDVAEVAVNGQPAGIVWEAPFAADVTSLVKPGRNELTVAVSNRWVNRMIGDEQLPPDADYAGPTDGSKFTIGRLKSFPSWYNDADYIKNRRRVSFPAWKHWEKTDPLLESGLIGPVKLTFRRVVDLDK